MPSPPITALALFLGLATASPGSWYIGGYSGLFEAGGGVPALQQLDGLWDGENPTCSSVGLDAPGFPKTDPADWCNTPFSVSDWAGGAKLQMGGPDSDCGNPKSTRGWGDVFAHVYNVDVDPKMTGEALGLCTYDKSMTFNCVSDGTLVYTSIVGCSLMNQDVIHAALGGENENGNGNGTVGRRFAA